jgi:hypothetical protein
MDCDQAQLQLPDYLAGEVPAGLKPDLDTHLAGCAACREQLRSLSVVWTRLALLPEEEPSPASAARFHAMIEAYRQGMKQAQRDSAPRVSLANWLSRWWPRQPALQFAVAVVLFAAGLLLGPALRKQERRSVAAGGTNDPALAQLREEVSNMKEMVTLALLRQTSPSERLRGVNWSSQLEQPAREVLDALLRALDSDPNVNVRLAAVDALQQFASDTTVRKGLLRSLAEQRSPLVQVELINLMVELKEKDSVPVLRELSQREELNPAVRERAEWGLQKLG